MSSLTATHSSILSGAGKYEYPSVHLRTYIACVWCVLFGIYGTVQTLVTQMWVSLSLSERAELRHFLMQHLVADRASLPSFVRNKLVKVIVLIGRADWPHHYPEFFAHVQQVSGTVTQELKKKATLSETDTHFGVSWNKTPSDKATT